MITHRWTVTAIDYAPTEIEEADSDFKRKESRCTPTLGAMFSRWDGR
jgi:hypothetical protein